MESLGFRLKKIREEKNISLEEIKKKTKLSLNVLKALEENNLTDYAPAYIKGFLKIYCKFLDIDPADFISEYEKNFILQKKEMISKKGLPKKIKLPFLPKIHPKTKRIIPSVLIILILTLSFIFGFSIFKRLKSSVPKKIVSSIKEDIKQKKELRIALKAKEDCWVRVYVDGKTVFQSILKKGRQESWQAEKKIVLDVGNAGALILEVDGKILSPLGRRGQVIKDILITREGVSIK